MKVISQKSVLNYFTAIVWAKAIGLNADVQYIFYTCTKVQETYF